MYPKRCLYGSRGSGSEGKARKRGNLILPKVESGAQITCWIRKACIILLLTIPNVFLFCCIVTFLFDFWGVSRVVEWMHSSVCSRF